VSYKESIAYLNQFINFERLPEPRFNTRTEDIARFRELLDELGKPQSEYPIIHIAGTKGKGSTAAIISSILKAAGMRVGLYTSPHLVTVRERFRIQGRIISKPEFASLIRLIRRTSERVRLGDRLAFRTVFEHLTAAALLWFAWKKIDIGIIEAGLGGRLDATIIVDPVLSILTPIGLDHTAILGNTVSAIAADKAHIIKPGVPAVSAKQVPEAAIQLKKRAEQVSSQLTFAPGSGEFERLSTQWEHQRCRTFRRWLGDEPFLVKLSGRFQLDNVSTALSAVEVLNRMGFAVLPESVKVGLSRINWPGRLQYIRGRIPLILDGSHNALSMEVLVDALIDLEPNRKFRVVFSAMRNKPVREMLKLLKQVAVKVYLTPLSFPKGMPVEELVNHSGQEGIVSVTCCNVPEALGRAFDEATVDEGILATGSLYLVGEVIRQRRGLPPPEPDGRIDDRI